MANLVETIAHGYCAECTDPIRGYKSAKGDIYWVHWPTLVAHKQHSATPSENTLRMLHGDR